MTKTLRASTSLLAALALMATAAVVCPCPPAAGNAGASAEHGCCASSGIKAADSCCQADSGRHESTPAPVAATTVACDASVAAAPALEPVLAGIEHPAPAPSAFRSPPILRI